MSYVIVAVVCVFVGILAGLRVSSWLLRRMFGLTKKQGDMVGVRVMDDGPGFIAIAIRMPADQRFIAEGVVAGMQKHVKEGKS